MKVLERIWVGQLENLLSKLEFWNYIRAMNMNWDSTKQTGGCLLKCRIIQIQIGEIYYSFKLAIVLVFIFCKNNSGLRTSSDSRGRRTDLSVAWIKDVN